MGCPYYSQHMKTTIEIQDDLMLRSQRAARTEGTTLRALVEEGLRLALSARRRKPERKVFSLPVFGKGGLHQEFQQAGWERIREAAYERPDGTE